MPKLVPPSDEIVLQLDKKPSIVSQCRLPSFRDGFSDWIQDTGHLDGMRSEVALNGMPYRQENAISQLPSIFTTLRRGWY